MIPSETVRLVKLVTQIAPAQRVDEFTPEAWHLVLGHLDYTDAAQAVVRVARVKPFIEPSAVIAEAKIIRTERLAKSDTALMIPDADPDDPVAYVAALRAGRYRPQEGTRRDVGALMAQVVKALPDVRAVKP